jgi:hypothetical protein
MVMVKMDNLNMTIIPFLSSNDNGQMVKKSGVVKVVFIKFGLTILTMKILLYRGWSWSNLDLTVETHFSQVVKNRGHSTPPP